MLFHMGASIDKMAHASVRRWKSLLPGPASRCAGAGGGREELSGRFVRAEVPVARVGSAAAVVDAPVADDDLGRQEVGEAPRVQSSSRIMPLTDFTQAFCQSHPGLTSYETPGSRSSQARTAWLGHFRSDDITTGRLRWPKIGQQLGKRAPRDCGRER